MSALDYSDKKELLQKFRLYAVTDIQQYSTDIFEKVDAAYEAGADIVQMRSKTLSDREMFDIGKALREIANKYQKLFFVNDRLDLALALEADGIHVGQDDMPIYKIKDIVEHARKKILIGKSTHSFEQALRAVEEDPDYIGIGPIYGTPTKPGYKPVGCELIQKVSQAIKIPFVTIGGINHSNLDEVLEAGATRVAVVRAIFSSEDVYESTKRIRERIEQFYGEHV